MSGPVDAVWLASRRAGDAGRADETVDLVEEWLATVDGRSTRVLHLLVKRRALHLALCELARRARTHGLLVHRLDVTRHGPVRDRDRGRSVLAIAVERRAARDEEAMAWMALAFRDVRLAGVVTVTCRATAREGGKQQPPAAHPPRTRSSCEQRRVGTSSEEGLWRRARGLERQGWRCLRQSSAAIARRLFRRAARAWLDARRADAAARCVLSWAAAAVAAHDLVAAERLAECGRRAAQVCGRHGWTARNVVERVRAQRSCVGPVLSQRGAAGAPRGHGWPRVVGDQRLGGNAVVEELMEVLQACHDVDEGPAIARVCCVVRERLSAAAVGVLAAGQSQPVAGAGRVPYASGDLSARALGAVEAIDPAPGEGGVEAAVPVRFGDAPIGALCCRWPAGSQPDHAHARALLSAAAAACAPSLRAWLERTRPPVVDPPALHGIIGNSEAVGRVRDSIRRAAVVPFPVLIEGESGSGKELVARAIHTASARRRRRFCAVNCAAITDELFEAELFGHARGAFTGAVGERAGLFEEADGGTLLLDEIGELTPRGQAKLLRVLQEGEVRRVGENVCRRVDVRIIAATNRSLAREAAAQRFRDDLRFRLDVIRINLPPLRERREDVPLLVDHFWRLATERTGGRARLDEAAVTMLTRYGWPGNVREVQNLMATLAVRAPARGRVRASDLPLHVLTAAPDPMTLETARREFDERYVRAALARCGGHRSEAARQLGLTRQGLSKLIARLALAQHGAAALQADGAIDGRQPAVATRQPVRT
jgi:DNA-binding NtrC family response regulator